MDPLALHEDDLNKVNACASLAEVRLTPQQERFIALHSHGFPVTQAAMHAGMTTAAGRALLEDESIQGVLERIRENYADAVRIDRETITVMLLESHRKAASATEEIAAAKELGKLHGLYKSDEQKGTKITTNMQINGDVQVAGTKRYARMDTEKLLELAAYTDSLEPT